MEPPIQATLQPQPHVAGKLLRAPSLKRHRNEDTEKFQLNHVLGVTVTSNSSLASDSVNHLVAYPSGCTIVLYNTLTNQQQSHIINVSRKTITSLAFSSDGKYLVTGECGHLPFVRVWDLQDLSQIAEFQAHQYGVNCVAFSPSNKFVVSVGSQHDMIVNVWDWRANLKIASNKVSTKVKQICFSQNGNYFVTVGNRHIKFWYLEYTNKTKYTDAVPLLGRAAILGTQRGQNFVAVVCGKGEAADNTYVITQSGLLCQLDNRRMLDKWVELKTSTASCLSIGERYIFVGCADSIIRCFDPITLQFIVTLPRTHYLGVDISQGINIAHTRQYPPNVKFPDTVAVTFDEVTNNLMCIYNDHSVYVWDVNDIKRVGKTQSFLYHSACIWGIEMCPSPSNVADARDAASIQRYLPEGTFITCSSDDTIRFWNLDKRNPMPNIYSNELIKIIYIDPELTFLTDINSSLSNSNEKVDLSIDGKNGVRCIRIRPDLLHLASGDRAGNIRIHHMKNLGEIFKIEAHDAEVLCLEYSKRDSGVPLMLASASRDRLIHIFNVDDGYKILQTLDDHSSSITAVKFIPTNATLKMISCGADKSIIFRNLVDGSPSGALQFHRQHHVAVRTTLYDMEVDTNGRHILMACQDRNVRIYSTRSGHCVKAMRGSPSDDGSLIKITLDSSGRYLATSSTDKTLAIYCACTGNLLASVSGHSELATGLRFMKNGNRLVSAGGDASILLWKMKSMKPQLVIKNYSEVDNGKFERLSPESPVSNTPFESPEFWTSDSPLPLWAKKKATSDAMVIPPDLMNNKPAYLPKGKWAQRVEQSGITIRSIYDTDSVITFSNQEEEVLHDSDVSKESSVDSGTESRIYTEYHHKETPSSKQKYTSHHHQIAKNLTQRHHVHTDDSSLGSMLGGSSALGGDTCEDSAAENDGDIEDCTNSDAESAKKLLNNKVHFPSTTTNLDSPTSEFTVNAMDVEELRKSQRRPTVKNRHLELPYAGISATSISGSQESDFDDEDNVSSPSGDNIHKNLESMGSVEAVDKIGKYLQSNFESLDGDDNDRTLTAENADVNTSFSFKTPTKHTLSSLHHSSSMRGTSDRNMSLVNETKQSMKQVDALGKRQELNRRIDETRKQLQSVGYRSNLKSSQSVLNLSPNIAKDSRMSINSSPKEDKRDESDKICLQSLRHTYTNLLTTNHQNHSRSASAIIHSFNIPANINIRNNIKTLPYFAKKHNDQFKVSQSKAAFYNSVDKFNEDMRTLLNNDVDEVPVKDCEDINKNSSIPMRSEIRPSTLPLNRINKTYKSLPVSPIEEKSELMTDIHEFDLDRRRSFTILDDLDDLIDDKSLKNKNFGPNDEDSFSSDSLEEPSEFSIRRSINKSVSNYNLPLESNQIPRSSSVLLKRCLYESNESLASIPERYSSASFYLTQAGAKSQESILSNFSDSESYQVNQNDDAYKLSKTNCNSLESILSDESVDTRSAPLEVLFKKSNEKNGGLEKSAKEENYVYKTKLKFENMQNEERKSISYFIKADSADKSTEKNCQIPTLSTKSMEYNDKMAQYSKLISKSQSCSFEVSFDSKITNKATNKNILSNSNTNKLTQSLDRNASQKWGFDTLIGDIVKHKPPKAVRLGRNVRNSRSMSMRVKKTPLNNSSPSNNLNNRRNSDYSQNIGVLDFQYAEYSTSKLGLCDSPNFISLDCTDNLDSNVNIKRSETFEVDKKDSLLHNEYQKIEEKIELINKLVHSDDDKFSIVNKGQVKKLLANFESLHHDYTNEYPIKRNLSLPCVLDRQLTVKNDLKSKRVGQNIPSAFELAEKNKLTLNRSKSCLNWNNCVKDVNLHVNLEVPFVDDDDSRLRRACSLSNLTDPTGTSAKKLTNHSAEKSARSSNRGTQPLKSRQLQYVDPSMTRSCSSLNQATRGTDPSGSESEACGQEKVFARPHSVAYPEAKPRSNLMRPTISSMNKTASAGKPSNALRRRSNIAMQTSYSTANLTNVGHEDSSSDEPIPSKNRNINRKDCASGKLKNRSNSICNCSTIGTTTTPTSNDHDLNQLANNLVKMANNVAKQYERLSATSSSTNDLTTSSDQSLTITQQQQPEPSNLYQLEHAILQTQQILLSVLNQRQTDKGDLGGVKDGNVQSQLNKLNNIPSLANQGDNSAGINFQMLQTLSDVLKNVVEQQTNAQSKSNQS